VNDAGIRQRRMNEADMGEIRRHLVDDPVRGRRTALPAFHPASIDRDQTWPKHASFRTEP
jgi:hypothetical protein